MKNCLCCLLIGMDRASDAGQAPRGYGTIASRASSSETLHEFQAIGGQDSKHVRVQVTEITEETPQTKTVPPVFWLIFCCICWNEFVSSTKLLESNSISDQCADDADQYP